MLGEPIAVLGGGNIAHAMAADLTLAGHDVYMFESPAFREKFRSTLESGEIEIVGVGRQGIAKIRKISVNIEEVIGDVKLINVCVPTTGQYSFFKEMIPHLKNGQTIVVWTGRFGSLLLDDMIRQMSSPAEVLIAETNLLPYGGTRMIGPARVQRRLKARRILISTLPSKHTVEIVDSLQELYPSLIPAHDVLSVNFSNPAIMTMGTGTLLNTGRIQYSEGDFYLWKEGITEAVARTIMMVYEEMKEIALAFGFPILEYEKREFMTTCSIHNIDMSAPFDTIGAFAQDREPSSIPHRFTNENLRDGLVPISQLGEKAGVSTNLINSLITLGSVVCNEDFWETGRTLSKLGIVELDTTGILNYIREGLNK
jgi:opine dehydrogenase